MINLTGKAATYFKEPFSSLKSREGDFWRIDIFTTNRRKILMCVHEITLTTHLLYAREFHLILRLAEYLKEINPWYNFNLSLGKGSNRRVTGSINDMEEFLNQTPFSYLPRAFPKDELAEYIRNRGLRLC